jgi:hypothetical protein
MQAMICTLGRIWTQLPTASYPCWLPDKQGMGGTPRDLLPLQHHIAARLPPTPPGNPSRDIPADCGCIGAAGLTQKRCVQSNAASLRSTSVTRCWMLGCCKGWMEHAMPLLRSSPSGHGGCSKGRAELPAILLLPDAGQSDSYRTLEDVKLLNGNG